ncbi:leucine-rich repeat domain-containing protein [Lentisphaera marina]|uniref:leucine-rich repeat domain-containing protein n=1 Tax=Lentisphaera marina TaxID=1111041 RepID=UPI00236657BA|nr:leucine-rich repeat domain-containing protein [Lentisphaera marina]MDD7986094.1 leucine-rich repeat domain-containing protein [Lentisphaera marina]
MFKKFLISGLLSLSSLFAEQSQISKYSANIKEYSSETRSKLKDIEESKNYSLRIGQAIDQKTFAKICSDIKWISDLSTEYGNKNLNSFAPLAKLKNLRQFEAISWTQSEETSIDLSPFENLTEIEVLNFYATRINNTASLKNLTKLRKLSLYMSEVNDISFLENLTNLEELDLYGFKHTFKDYAPLKNLVTIKKLNTYMNTQASNENMQVFANLTALEEFSSSNNKLITHVNFLKNATQLVKLKLKWCRKLQDIEALKNCQKIKNIDLTDSLITSITVLQNKIHLEDLDISGTKVTDLSPLKSCKQLQSLDISDTAIKDLSALAFCPNLKSLNLSKTNIQDLSPLHKSKSLRHISYSLKIPDEEISILKKFLPDCKFRINN